MSENGRPLLTVNNIEVIYDHVILVLGVAQAPEGTPLLGAGRDDAQGHLGLLRTERAR